MTKAARKMSTTLRDAQRQATSRLLIEAAVRVFARVGYTRATIDEIVSEAGASRATFYLHFKTKSDVLAPMLERAGEGFAEPYSQFATLAAAPDEAAINVWIRAAMERWSTIEDHIRPAFEAAESDTKLFAELFPEQLPGIGQLTDALKNSGVLSDQKRAEVYATVLLAPLLHYFRMHLRNETFDRELACSVMARVWFTTLSELVEAIARRV